MGILDIQHISKEIEGKKILHDINFSIEKHDFVALVGVSGAGKSTILSLISGLDYISEGSILFDGKTLEDPREQLIRGNEEIRVVKQDYDLYPHHRVYDILELPIRQLHDDEITERIAEMLSFFDLEDYKYELPKSLSGGMRQRLSIAHAMITFPKLLLLDEPFSHLDAFTSMECLSYIKKLAKSYGTTVVYVTHETEYALMYANKIMVVSDGEIIQKGTPQEVYQTPLNLEVAQLFSSASSYKGEIIRPENVDIVKFSNSKLLVISCLYLGENYLLTLSNNEEILYCKHKLFIDIGTEVFVKVIKKS